MNELKHRAEFIDALSNYKLSPAAMDALLRTRLLLLAGLTSSGRNTIINGLVKLGDYYHIVSDTTRQIRLNNGLPIEKDGREYWFRSEEDILNGLRSGDYIEAAIIHDQQVSGCNTRELDRAIETDKIAVKDIEQIGAKTIHSLKPETKIIFITPPSFEAWMQRIHSRGGLPAEEIKRRIKSSLKELDAALTENYYSFVINMEIEATIIEVDAIAKSSETNPKYQQLGRQLAKKLFQAAENYLQTAKA